MGLTLCSTPRFCAGCLSCWEPFPDSYRCCVNWRTTKSVDLDFDGAIARIPQWICALAVIGTPVAFFWKGLPAGTGFLAELPADRSGGKSNRKARGEC